MFELIFYKNYTGSFVEDKCSQGEDGNPRKCVNVQVRGYDGLTKGSLTRKSKEETIFRMAGKVS